MKLATCALLLLLATLSPLARGSDDPTVSLPGVTDLTPDNFASEHNGRRAALIEFYAPWCGHCKRLTPEYQKLGEKIAADPKLKNRVLIAKVDADAHRELGEKFSVQGFPTIKWFPRGKPADPVDYQGGRTMDDFLKFINEKVSADAGFARVDALVPLAQKFAAAAAGELAGIVAEAEKAAEAVSADDKENAALYVRFMKKAAEKGADWIPKELERLTKMSEKPMSASKLDEVSRKMSVLSSFTEKPEESAGSATGAAATDAATDAAAAASDAASKAGDDDDEGEEVYADGLEDAELEEEVEEEEDADEDEDEGEEAEPAVANDDDDPYDDSEL